MQIIMRVSSPISVPCFFFIVSFLTWDSSQAVHLNSNEDSYITGVQGFGVDIQCVVNTCLHNSSRIKWYKNDEEISTGLTVHLPESKAHINHFIGFHPTRDCEGTVCSESNPCPDSQHCLQNSCCYCVREEFTLVIKNLTLQDSGTYRCEVDRGRDSLEFTFEVYESGIYPGFNKNLTFDHSECCEKQNMSRRCQPMCKPGELETHKFDPLDCDTEISKFLHCVTEGGNVSHVHCCRLQLVPPFCWDFCTGDLDRLREAHHLCLYWLPEILECYEHAYLPLPEPPESVSVQALGPEELKACWESPKGEDTTVNFYTVEYKEVPRFPFLGGGGNPFMSSFRGSPDAIDSAVEMEDPPSREPRSKRVERFDPDTEDGWKTEVTLEDGSEGTLVLRRKRQTSTWVFFTHNGITNETRVKEFKFLKENTTDTCHTIKNLQPATQYIVYVTATNEHGTSLPSVRTVVATAAVLFKNGTLPDIGQCCKDNGVEPICIPKLCDLDRTPSAFGALDIALNCRAAFSGVAPCLADGRDHSPCCRSKGVTGECLRLCDGSATYLGLHSVRCLMMDMNAVYTCIRMGYVTHPSPPRNMTVTEIRSSSAVVSWEDPESNAENVETYSMFYRREDRARVGFAEVKNVSSPYELINLDPGVSYMVYLIAHGKDGSSLQSSVQEFFTQTPDDSINICPMGVPLRGRSGERFYCSRAFPCPHNYDCIVSGESETFCCPNVGPPPTPAPGVMPNVTECCARRGMLGRCQNLCSYTTTVSDLLTYGTDCIQHIKDWVDCGSDGRDHRPCCFQRGVPEVCLAFCLPPLRSLSKEHLICVKHVQDILTCGAEGVLKLPGPPKNLRVVSVTSSTVRLAWDRAHQVQSVTHYTLELFSRGKKVREENVTGLSTDVTNLDAGRNYTGRVFARNEHGSSIASNNVSFTAPVDSAGEADKPTSPHNLQLAWNQQSRINVTWDWDGKSTNGQNLSNVKFKVLYALHKAVGMEEWTEKVTNEKWAVLEPLERNKNYDVKVVAVNGDSSDRESDISEVISVPTVSNPNPPSFPIVTFNPAKTEYREGEEIEVTCISTSSTGTKPTVTLTIPANKPKSGPGTVSQRVTVSGDLANGKMACEAKDATGKTAKKHESITVLFSASAAPPEATIKVLDRLTAEFVCRVKGYPEPKVTWSYTEVQNARDSKLLSNSANVTMKMGSTWQTNLYNATLTIKEAFKFNAGYYKCKACNALGCQTAQFQLIVQDLTLPKGPREIEDCCKEQNVKKECMFVCAFNLQDLGDSRQVCAKEVPKLLHCARNGIDHSQCCSQKGVPQRCMGLCDKQRTTDATQDLRDCGDYRQQVLNCILERQQFIPSVPVNVEVTAAGESLLRVRWKVPKQNGDSVLLYVVYYKSIKESNYKMMRTNKTEVILTGLKPNTSYEVAVLAANNRGFSDFSASQSVIVQSQYSRRPARTAAGAILGVIFCLLLAAVIILGVLWFTRRRPYRIPAFFTKLRSRHVPGSGSVAFENPGYDREGQIRGLPGDNFGDGDVTVMNGHTAEGNVRNHWEKADLTSPNDNGSPTPLQKGLKYTQMST